jgi:hypothetical protein
MSSENIPCVDGPGIRGEVRAWSEDPLTARARSIWSGADFLPIARSFAPGAAEFIARLAGRESVLDVARGTGNLAIPAARAGAGTARHRANLIAQARLEAHGPSHCRRRRRRGAPVRRRALTPSRCSAPCPPGWNARRRAACVTRPAADRMAN